MDVSLCNTYDKKTIENPLRAFSKMEKNKCGRSRSLCRPLQLQRIAIWNVEGLLGPSISKLAELRLIMKEQGISILCLQETHVLDVEYFEEEGFTVFLSGAAKDGPRSYAGVGFMVAPWAIKSVFSFKAVNERIASLRVKVTGGVVNVLSVYAPHDGHEFEKRHHFFAELSENTRQHKSHETTLVYGDFNTQLRYVGYDEDTSVGPYIFKKSISGNHTTIPNRSLFLECCGTHKLVVVNSLFDYPDEVLVTYHNLNSKPMDNIANGSFSQLDYVLCPHKVVI